MTDKRFTVTIEDLETGQVTTQDLAGFCLLHVFEETEDDFTGSHHFRQIKPSQLAQLYQKACLDYEGLRAAEMRITLERISRGIGLTESEPCDCPECTEKGLSVEEVPEA